MANAAFTANEEKYDFGNVPVALLSFDENNVRSDYREAYDDVDEEIENLAASIAEVGLVEPIIVERIGDVYKLISGERRLRAIKFLNAKNPNAQIVEIPAKIYEGIADSEKKLIQLVENLQRKGLSDYDKIVAIAGQFEQIKETIDPETGRKYSQKKYASVVGISRTQLGFFTLIAKREIVLSAVKNNLLTYAFAYKLLSYDDVDIANFLDQIQDERIFDPERKVTGADISAFESEVASRPKGPLPFTTAFKPAAWLQDPDTDDEPEPDFYSHDYKSPEMSEQEMDSAIQEMALDKAMLDAELEYIDEQVAIKEKIFEAEKQREALLTQTFGEDCFDSVELREDESEEQVCLPEIPMPTVYRLPAELAPHAAAPVNTGGVSFAGAAFAQGLSEGVNFNNTFGMRTFAVSANKARSILSGFYSDIQNLNDMQVFDRFEQFLKS
jgi:ParB/RepB/Spo0J family partition protein